MDDLIGDIILGIAIMLVPFIVFSEPKDKWRKYNLNEKGE